ncbi:unnamed protein product [Schistocephalus solidus]|uniref:Uncharacterized protein n=1 Tax=Schistocephalus solidus TaxID=70667 RepID=A0A183SMC4_SCHSO|nr:unnamed protein product [Schistocephalus solidus]
MPQNNRNYLRHSPEKRRVLGDANQLQPTLVDSMEAFDMMNRNRFWEIMQNFCCPDRFTHMVCQLHDGTMEHFTDNGTESKAFAAKHGCVLAPTLSSLTL